MPVDLGLVAPVKDGVVAQSSASTNSIKNAQGGNKKNDLVSSDTFLQLLVAEMQNQDPLEPTSNTDWIAQYATFTQVSEIQSIGDNMDAMTAQGMVGKSVILDVVDDKGNHEEVSGIVDFVTYEDKKAYVTIDGKKYAASDIKTVLGDDYLEVQRIGEDMAEVLKKLPELEDLTIAHKDDVVGLKSVKESLTPYQLKFMDQEALGKIDQYYSRMVTIVEEYNEKLAAMEEERRAAEEAEAAEKETEKQKEMIKNIIEGLKDMN